MTAQTVYIPLQHSLGSIIFDAVVSEQHRSKMRITTHPIDRTGSVADHSVMEPKTVKIRAAIGAVQSLAAANADGSNTASQGYTGVAAGEDVTRMSSAYETMIYLQESQAVFDVVTGLKLYKNCMLEDIDVTQDIDSETLVYFEAIVKTIKIVDVSQSTYDIKRFVSKYKVNNKVDRETKSSFSESKNRGNVKDTNNETRKKSALKSLLEGS